MARSRYFSDAARSDWHAAATDGRDYADALRANPLEHPKITALEVQTRAMPLLAEAVAQSGDFNAAQAAIEPTPLDCYDCLRERGRIAALETNWTVANNWFARAVAAAPSVPFAYADWGRMLLVKGDADAATAKLAIAVEKGPHFADPLEGWGEALMAKNQSHLALAKFEEANKYAPHWGRLHLKWSEALIYAGKKNEAAKQLAQAASLDLGRTI